MNERITLKIEKGGAVVSWHVGGKLWYQAPGLDIYVEGAVKNSQIHLMHYLAACECIDRHIPLISLKKIYDRKPPTWWVHPGQRSLL